MAILIGLAVSLLASIIAIEMYTVMPKLTDWLLHIATRQLSGGVKERCFEEWQAQLADIPSPLVRLIHATSLIARANTVLRDDIDGYFRELDADIEGFLAATNRSAEARRKHLKAARTTFLRMRIRMNAVRLALLFCMFVVRGKGVAILTACLRISKRATPFYQALHQFDRALTQAYKIIADRETAVNDVVRKIQAEKRSAAAAAAKTNDYTARAPAIAAELRRKLGAEVARLPSTDEAHKRARERIAVASAAIEIARAKMVQAK